MEQLDPRSRRDAFGSKINRDHVPILMYGVPWLSIMFCALSPMLPIIAPAPILPPLSYLMLLGWRMYRPGLLPMWAGLPLGLFDDLFSGQPLGCGILLFSLTLISLDFIEVRVPWRGFWQNWPLAALYVALYLLLAALFSGTSFGIERMTILLPQWLIALALFPPMMALVGALDRLRLMRLRRLS